MKASAFLFVSALLTSGVAGATPGGLPFIRDDFARARAEANRRKLPMFVDVWAPW